MSRFVPMAAVILVGCGTSFTPTDGGGVDGGVMDAGATDGGGRDASTGDGGFVCAPVPCAIDCEHGFQRDEDGCEICACNPPPVDSCAVDADCVLARVATSCCSCENGYPQARVDADPCLVERGEIPPPGCLPDPDFCAMVDCAACEAAVRAFCDGGTCQASGECAPGDVPFRLTCVPACTSHADCTLGADYGSCCGGCDAAPRAYDEADPCFAERRSDSECSPAPGACDGLGCPSPADDCTAFGGSAVCMEDGSCQQVFTGSVCPPGFHDDGDVCVAD